MRWSQCSDKTHVTVAPPTDIQSVEFMKTIFNKRPAANLTHIKREAADACCVWWEAFKRKRKTIWWCWSEIIKRRIYVFIPNKSIHDELVWSWLIQQPNYLYHKWLQWCILFILYNSGPCHQCYRKNKTEYKSLQCNRQPIIICFIDSQINSAEKLPTPNH